MQRFFVDTDVIYDLIETRMPHYTHAARLFSRADKNKLELYASAISFVNLNYILGRDYNSEVVRKKLLTVKALVTILPVDEKTLDLALNSEFSDFEDAVQYFCCLAADIPVLLTRNLKDYKHAQIPVMTPETYLKS